MKFKSKLLCLLLVFVLLLSVSAVAANETTTQSSFKEVSADPVSVSVESNNEILGISNSEESLGATDNNEILCATDGGTFRELQDKINAADGVLVLENDYKNSDNFNQNGISISKSLTIDGNGYTIDALGKGRIFQVTASNVILKNINFINGEYSGGAILWNGVNGTLSGCSFVNNSGYNGGAVYWSGNGGTLSGCSFVNNSAAGSSGNGFAVCWSGDDGVLSSSNFTGNKGYEGAVKWIGNNGTLSGSNFTNNEARFRGGAVLWNGVNGTLSGCSFVNNSGYNGGAVEWGGDNGTLSASNFTNNEAAHRGGAVQWYGDNGTLSASNFISNVVNYRYTSLLEGGGAVAWNGDNGTLSASNFTNNEASHRGGAVQWTRKNGTLSGCSFVNNSAPNGGAVYWNIYRDGTLYGRDGTLYGSSFIGNNAIYGGAVYWTGINGNLTGSSFIGNNAIYGGAVFWSRDATNGSLSGSTFINNSADSDGGAVYWTANNGSLGGSTFINNSADSDGGAVSWEGANGVLSGSSFINNSAVYGGAVYLYHANNGNLTGSNFTGNSANDSGGAVFLNFAVNFTLSGSYFTNNSAGRCSAVWWFGADGVLSGCNFTGNRAGEHGGAVSWQGDNGVLTDSTFINNSANYTGKDYFGGGAVWWHADNCTLSGSTFIGNSAEFGGAVYLGGNFGDDSVLRDSIFIGNSAEFGGAVYLYQANNFVLSGSNFTGNSAHDSGGAVYCKYSNNGVLSGSNFTGNNASNGGAVYWRGVNGILSESSFINNSAKYYSFGGERHCGGAVFWDGAEGVLSSSVFVNNSALEDGGAVFWKAQNGTLNSSNFTNNDAKYGGGVNWRGLYGVLYGSVFIDNFALDSGGAVCWIYSNGHLSGSVFLNNSASEASGAASIEGGGAVFWNGPNGLLTGSYFAGNKVRDHGGAVSWWATNGTLSESIFINNSVLGSSSYGGGGAVYWEGINGTLNGSNFTGNKANRGGAVHWSRYGGNLTSSSFVNNSARQFGGAVFWALHSSNGVLSCSTFINNSASWGGAISWLGADGSLSGSTFTGNNASNGGAVYWLGPNGTLSGSTFTGNNASNGGAVYWFGVDGSLSGSNFAGNNASVHGGAVFWGSNAPNGTLADSSFTGNNATSGGAVYLSTYNSTLNNSNFTNNTANSGGAVSLLGGDNVLTRSIFINNSAKSVGGAVWGLVLNGILSASSFVNNSATSGGAIGWEGTNGTFSSSNFTGNKAQNGGAIYLYPMDAYNLKGFNCVLSASSFTGNNATDGGAVYWNCTNGTLRDSSFINNSANAGGAVYWSGMNGTLSGSSFDNNSAGFGGAVFWSQYATNGTLSDSSFNYNSGDNGGAVRWDGASGTLTGSSFNYNSARFGGAVYWDGASGVLDNSSFDYNSGDNGGAVFWSQYATNGNLTGSSFINNSATNLGGAVYWDGADGVLSGSNFTGNNASVHGGAVYWDGADGVLSGSNFTGNNATSGGAVDWWGVNGTLSGSTFIDNTAVYGGAVSWVGDNGTLGDSNFVGNTAVLGGAVSWNGDNGTLSGSTFTGNNATSGGAVDWWGVNGTLSGSTFIDNTAVYGGAVYWNKDNGTLTGSSFVNNSAGQYGGAVIWYEYATNGTLSGSSFIGNKARFYGGAVYWYYPNGVIKDSSFENNIADLQGGAIYWTKLYYQNRDGSCQVINSSFISNHADFEGGAAHFWDINVNVNNSFFKNNSAKHSGAISVRRSDMAVDNSNFTSNFATYGGGAIGNNGDRSEILAVEIKNSNFDNNHANNYGGALSLENVLVDNSNFNNNSAVFGGAIYSISPTVKNSKFRNNKALELGNNIFAINKATIENSNINDIYENKLTESIIYDYVGSTYKITYEGKTYDAFSVELLSGPNGQTNDVYVVDPSFKLVRNVLDSSDVSEYVKSLLYKYFKGELSYNDVEGMIYSAVEGNPGINGEYNAPEFEYIGNNMVNVYEYISLITPSSNTNLVFLKQTTYTLNYTVTKEALNKTAFVGDIVKFRINVTNGNYFTLPDVFVKDVFNDGELEYLSFESKDNWSYNINSKVFTLKSLSPSNTSSIILSFKVKTNGTLTNIAVSGIGENETGNNNTNITVYNPQLAVEKVSLTPTVVLGQTARFEIIVKNNGDSDLHNVILTENPGQGLVFDSYDNTGLWKHSIVNNKHVWTLVNTLTPGSSVSLFVNFKTTALGRLVNYADVESDETNKSTTGEGVDVIKPEIKVEKIVLTPNVSLGEQAVYEIVVHNIGEADLTNIVVEEMPDASLVFDHYVDNGLFTHSFVNGKHIWTLDKLSKGTYAGFFVYFNTTAAGNISNKISVKSDEIPENTTISNNTNVLLPTFSVEKICLVPNVLVGNQTQFQIVIKNTGKIELTNVYFTEESFNGLIYDGAIGEGIWTYKFENGKHTWTLNEALEADEFAVLILRFNTTAKGNYTNFVSAGSDQTGVLIANATVHVFENELPDPVENSSDDYKMDVFKTVVTQEAVLGGQITFQIVVHNTGNKNLENVKITEILPDGLIYSHFVDYLDLWTYNGDLTWSATRAILSGEYVSFFVTFNTTKPGKFENYITVTADKANATAGNSSFEILNPDFTIEKILVEDNIANGGQATFEIVIHNTGNAPLNNLTVREYFFDGLVYDHFVDYSGLWSYIGDLTWAMNSKLAPGEYVGFFVTFNTTKDGKFINIVVANSTECGNKFSNNATVSVHNETVDIRMISLTPLVIVGNQVTFEITVQNTGKINISALKISEYDFEGLIYDHYIDYLGHWINDGITWTLNTTLVPGEVTSLFVIFNTTRVGNFTNVILVNNDVLDTNELLSANSLDEGIYVSAAVEVVKPEYTIEKVALNKTANIGDEVIFEIIVHNTGKVNITSITVRDIPSDGLEYLRFIDSEGFWSKNSDLSWNLIGNLVPGQYSIFYVVFNATKAGNLENSLESDNLTSKTTVEVKNPVVPTNPALIINVEVTTDPITGQPVLKVTVTNIGNVDLDNVFVKANLPEGLKYGNYYSYGSIWNFNNDEFTLEGLLKASESKSFFIEILGEPGDYQIKIDAGYNGTIADIAIAYVKVLDNSTPGNNVTPEVPKDNNVKKLKSSVAIGNNATGNPLLMVLLVLFALGVTRFRKKD